MKGNELREKIKEAACSTHNWIQNAVGDMTYDWPNDSFMDDEWSEKIKQAKKRGVTDIKGWLADEYYNDVDILRDICGDHIHDRATEIIGTDNLQHSIVMILICKKIKDRGHTALNEAMDKIIKNNQEFLDMLTKENKERLKQCTETLLKPIT